MIDRVASAIYYVLHSKQAASADRILFLPSPTFRNSKGSETALTLLPEISIHRISA